MNQQIQGATVSSAMAIGNGGSGIGGSSSGIGAALIAQNVQAAKRIFKEQSPQPQLRLTVEPATNGHIIRYAKHDGEIARFYVVKDGDSLPEALAAVIALANLEQ